MKKPSQSIGERFSDIRFLFDKARQYAKSVIVYTVLTAVVGVAMNVVELLAMPLILTQVESASALSTLFITVGAFAAGLFVLRFAGQYFEGAFAESRDLFRTRGSTALAERALTVSYPYATDPRRLRLLARAAKAMDKHIHAPIPHLWKTFSNLLLNAVGLIVYMTLLLEWNAWLLIVTAATAVLGSIVHRRVTEWGYRRREEEETLDKRLSYVSRTAASTELSKDIRVFGLAPWLKEIHDSSMRAMEAFINRRARIYLLFNIADAILTLLRNGIAYIVLICMTITQPLYTSAFLLYFAAIGYFTNSVSGLLTDLATLQRELPELRAYREYLEQEDDFCFENGALPASGCLHTLELRDVSFTYPSAEKPILEHVSLTLHEGERLAIVGRDGSGKSALARLLCGLYDPDEGEIRLDGADVRTLDRRAYYALFSAVFQEHALLDMTVAEHVTHGCDSIDEGRMWDCMEKAGFAQTVRDLPRGIDTHIGRDVFEDGVLLSGGQMQRLLLARALYKNGDVLILDEPTAALDPLAEHELYQEYDRMTAGKSAVFISHRLASTRFCDRIIYLKNGTIAEEGTHEELMMQAGEYARLYEVQSRYYREGRDPDGDEIG